MDQLIQDQECNISKLQQIASNYKKDPLERRTLAFIDGKSTEFDEEWIKINKIDNIIPNKFGDDVTHPYFFNTIRQKYREERDGMDDAINAQKAAQRSRSPSLTNEPPIQPTEPAGVDPACRMKIVKQRKIIGSIRNSLNLVLNDRTPQTSKYYAMQLESIERHWKTVQDLHGAIVDPIDAFDTEVYSLDEYIKMEHEINTMILILQDKAEQGTSTNREPRQFSGPTSSLKLPKIELPKFDGNYGHWRQFHDLFLEIVDKQSIPARQKLYYLKSSLSGEAATLIQHLSSTEANYSTAWTIITERYENKRLLAHAILQRLLSPSSCPNDNAAIIKGLHDTTQECLRSLQNLGLDTSSWDPFLMLVPSLSKGTHALWEQSLAKPRELPSLEAFLKFLRLRFQSLEALGSRASKTTNEGRFSNPKVLAASRVPVQFCTACKGNHPIFHCKQFQDLTPQGRLNLIQQAKNCVNCLKEGHRAKDCTSRNCSKCGKRHNTMLHLITPREQPVATNASSVSAVPAATAATRTITTAFSTTAVQATTAAAGTDILEASTAATALADIHTTAMSTNGDLAATAAAGSGATAVLSTVLVTTTDSWGNKLEARAILDSGSQLNFITERFAKQLGMHKKPSFLSIQGIGESTKRTSGRLNVLISSRNTGFSRRIEAHLLPTIVSRQPHKRLNVEKWKIPDNIPLADPSFYEPGNIDLLIGAGLFYSTMCVGQIQLGDGLPLLQNTLFGWIVGGEYTSHPITSAVCGMCTEEETLNEAMEKFWRLEQCDERSKNLTIAERHCENHFTQNTHHHTDGRFMVRLPFKHDARQLGDSKDIALQRFRAIERRFAKDSALREQYISFMREYEALGHMEEVSIEGIKGPHYFLPHHAVTKADSTTTKLRVVFDASAKTSTNVSLNDLLATGPTIQDDVFTSLLRFRLHRYAFTANIEKMYRQVWISPADWKFQLILWREDPTQPIKCYQLTTVTYGTTSAPYLATRCLQKLADESVHKYPLAAEALNTNFYVDDVLTGSDQIAIAVEMQAQLRTLLKTAGLNLRKWCANDQRLLNNVPLEDREVRLNVNARNDNVKTMGLTWHPKEDFFSIKIHEAENRRITKRSALSDIVRIFDPLGFIAPVVVTAKIFLQKLWKLKLDGDAELPQDLHSTWTSFKRQLHLLQTLTIPRHVISQQRSQQIQVHIFADASEQAYGAVAYVRIVTPHNVVVVRFLCAKSKVAPVKQISLPRLELCAAHLAATLMQRIQKDLQFNTEAIFLWSDSTIVLNWINAESSHYHTFVANRIILIQQVTCPQQWRHVPSEQNPADLISRGVMPKRLVNNNFWFYGPMFLHGPVTSWPMQPPREVNYPLERKEQPVTLLTTTRTDEIPPLLSTINHGNSFRKLQRIIAYMLRFKDTPTSRPKSPLLSPGELERALAVIIKIIQGTEFKKDITNLSQLRNISANSVLSTLTPFLDNDGILRVGGRLESSSLSYDAKHPMLLPYGHHVTRLLLESIHKEHLHAGPQTLLSIVRQRFWLIKGKMIARAVVHSCVQCTRAKPKLLTQLMGDLPEDRVQPARLFVNSGVDFFGPVWTDFKVRGKRPLKAYVAVFCCFATKAVHLELVSDLTTDAFLGALKRFLARRGQCKRIYCDNATNFVGAKNQLQELHSAIHGTRAQEKITAACNQRNIEFSFIPPRAPHFGGLWEPAVKSAKTLLQSSLSSASLTYEEMETVIIEAEAVMNSRPLTPLTTDPNDLQALTPGHLLTGEPLVSTIDPKAQQNKTSLLTGWKLVSQIKEDFWRRWSTEYLNQLQQRSKWKQECHNVKEGTMVIIKEDNIPPLKWPLGRIVNVVQGRDGLVRVADIRTASTTIRRPIHKLAPLPIEDGVISSLADQQMKQEKSNEETPRKRMRLSTGSTIVSLLITALFIPFVTAEPVDVQPFSNNPGIYFENIGSAGIINSEWNLITYFRLEPFLKTFDTIQTYPKLLNDTCDWKHNSRNCQAIMDELRRFINDLQLSNQLLRPKLGNRSRRGALNFIGNVAHSLFGVLDDDYGQEMSNTIDKIRQDLQLNFKNKIRSLTAH